MPPLEHAWSVFTPAKFHNGLLHHLRLELVRQDPVYISRNFERELNNTKQTPYAEYNPPPILFPILPLLLLKLRRYPHHSTKEKWLQWRRRTPVHISSLDNLKRGRTPATVVPQIGDARRPLRRRTVTTTATAIATTGTAATPTTARLSLQW